jgi:acetolactate synthase small subunit
MSARKSERSTACFSVTAQAAPGVLPRVLEYFAKRGLVPDRLEARRGGGELVVDIQVINMDPERAHYIGRCLDRIFEVDRVLVSEKRYADVA